MDYALIWGYLDDLVFVQVFEVKGISLNLWTKTILF